MITKLEENDEESETSHDNMTRWVTYKRMPDSIQWQSSTLASYCTINVYMHKHELIRINTKSTNVL